MKSMMTCLNKHTSEVEIEEEEGLRYWICPVCNIVVGLKNKEGYGFTGHKTKELILLFRRKV